MSGLSASDAHSSNRVAARPCATLKFPDGELDTWVCLGHITNQSIRVWLRAPSLSTSVASLKINGQPVAEAPLQSSADHAFVDAVDIPLPQASGGGPFAVHAAGHRRQGFLPPPPHQQPNDFERSAFAAATQAYLEYQHLHNPGATLRDRAPFCYGFWYADVGFLVLDLRSQRDFDAGQVIGEEQWEKLESFLAEATECETRTLFVVVTIPVVHFPPVAVRLLDGLPGSKGENIRDRWDAEKFRLQRDRLLHRLCDWQARGRGRQVVILSGDVHAGAAFQVKRKHSPGEVLQWTSSPLTSPIGPGQLLVNNIGSALVNLGEKDFLVTREAIQARNNFGVVRAEPLSPGEGVGHRISFILYKYQPSRRR